MPRMPISRCSASNTDDRCLDNRRRQYAGLRPCGFAIITFRSTLVVPGLLYRRDGDDSSKRYGERITTRRTCVLSACGHPPYYGLEPFQHLSAYRSRRLSGPGIARRQGEGVATGRLAGMDQRSSGFSSADGVRCTTKFGWWPSTARGSRASQIGAQPWVSAMCPREAGSNFGFGVSARASSDSLSA